MERTLSAICELLHGELVGDGATLIRGINALNAVGQDELTFAEDSKHLQEAMGTPAAAIIVSKEVRDLGGRSGIRVDNPKLAFALLLGLFYHEEAPAPGIHPTAILGNNVQLGEGVAVLAHAVIGDNTSIGRGTTIGAGVVIGDDVAIGEHCVLDPSVVVYRRTLIGDRVLIHSGSVIGGDGFGYILHQGAYFKVPQVGNVVIENDVEIGCNVCVDRATMGSTMIRQGTKIDNLVQIAHNDRIGKHVVMAGQVGLSGSVSVGDYTVMGGKAGIVDHVTVGERVQIGAASVVTKSVANGEAIWGYPARPVKDTKQQMASLARLPMLFKRFVQILAQHQRNTARLTRLEHDVETLKPPHAPAK